MKKQTISRTFRIPERLNDDLGRLATSYNMSMNRMVVMGLEFVVRLMKKQDEERRTHSENSPSE